MCSELADKAVVADDDSELARVVASLLRFRDAAAYFHWAVRDMHLKDAELLCDCMSTPIAGSSTDDDAIIVANACMELGIDDIEAGFCEDILEKVCGLMDEPGDT